MSTLINEEKCWKKLFRNVNMSSIDGRDIANTQRKAAHDFLKESATLNTNGNKVRKGNQSTSYHEVHITIDDLKEQWKIQNGKCYWLGIDMSLQDLFISRSPFAVSVDRLVSSGHYTKDNIVLTTRFANLGKGAYDREDFKERLDSLFKNK
jgi:hypothetical protein